MYLRLQKVMSQILSMVEVCFFLEWMAIQHCGQMMMSKTVLVDCLMVAITLMTKNRGKVEHFGVMITFPTKQCYITLKSNNTRDQLLLEKDEKWKNMHIIDYILGIMQDVFPQIPD